MQRRLKDKADERNTYIKIALDALSDAYKASKKSNTREDAGHHQGHVPGRGEREARHHHRQWSTATTHQ
jgi:hypothetical protein